MEKYTESQKRPSQAKRTVKQGTSYKQHNVTQEYTTINKDNMCISTEYYNENNTETMKIDHVPYLDAKYSDKVIYCGSSDTYVTTAYLDENNNYIDINIEPQIDIDSLPELAQELIFTTQKEIEENENKVEKQTTNSNENKLVQIKLKTLTEKIDSAFKEIKSFETTDYPSLENTKQISTIKYPYLSYNINSIDKLSTNIKWHEVTEEYQKTLIENMKTILIKAQEEIKQSTNNNYNTKTETKMLEDCTDDISEISCGNNYCIAIND